MEMGSERTSRWKHTDTHADLRAFLGDAANLFTRRISLAQRQRHLQVLADRYGLSSTLSEQAMTALELSRGDSRVAYELLAQWSIDDGVSSGAREKLPLTRRPSPGGEQATHEGEIELDPAEIATWNSSDWLTKPASADSTGEENSPSRILEAKFESFVKTFLTAAERQDRTEPKMRRELLAAAVRQFGMQPDSARTILARLLPASLPPETGHDRPPPLTKARTPSPAASPDTLPDLESIVEEEADWLQRHREQAIGQSQTTESGSNVRDIYREYLDQRLANLRGNRIDARQWKKLLDHGTGQFGLTADDAAHLIEERAHRRRMQVLTPQRALDQLTVLASSLYRRTGRLSAAARTRLLAAANQLGLEACEARRILEAPPPGQAVVESQRPLNIRLLIAISGTAACVMLTFFLWVAVSQRPGDRSIAVIGSESEASVADKAAGQEFHSPQWWDQQTTAAAQELSAGDDSLRLLLNQFAAGESSQRQAAALGFYRNIDFAAPAFLQHSEQYGAVLLGYLALEPDQAAAVNTYRAISDSIQEISGEWPAGERVHRALYWRLDLLLRAVESPLVPRPRAEAFAATLAEVLQITVISGNDLAVWRQACMLAMTQRCFGMMMDSPAHAPERVLAAGKSLALACKPFVPQPHLDRFESKLLCGMLIAGQHGRPLLDAIEQQIKSADTLNVLRFVAAYELMPVTDTRNSVETMLLVRAGLRDGERTAEQTARVIRVALDSGPAGDRYIDRWEQFTFAAESMLKPAAAPLGDRQLPHAILLLAHQNLLGAALANHNQEGAIAFDQYAAEGAPQLTLEQQASLPLRPVSSAAASSSVMPAHVAKELLRRAQLLTGSLPSREQEYQWEIVVRIVERWNELPPPVAALVGRYVLAELDPRMDTLVVAQSQRVLVPLPDFQLALAEAIATSPLDDPPLSARLSTLLGRPLVVRGDHGRSALRQTLLESAYEVLSKASLGGAAATDRFLALREHLTRVYQAKARMWNVSPGAYLTAANPADMLAALIEWEIAESPERLTRKPSEANAALASARFRARSELEETVLLQRLWLELLADHIAADSPAKVKRIAAIMQASSESSSPQSLLAQLQDGEQLELRLWLIRHEMR